MTISKNIRNLDATPAIIAVNAAVWVALRLVAAVINVGGIESVTIDTVIDRLVLPHSFSAAVLHPWTALTYMFVQYDVMHLMMNMLWLLLFARIAESVSGRAGLWALYVAGGLAGAVAYLLVPAGGAVLIGASASVMAVMAYTVVRRPQARVKLVFFGDTSLRVVALIAVLLVALGSGVDNIGAHAAHAGGFAGGVLVALYAQHRAKAKRVVKPSAPAAVNNNIIEESTLSLDELLDKIRRSGFESLTPSERVRLFKISANLNRHSQQQQS